jgi:hypothetical protein
MGTLLILFLTILTKTIKISRNMICRFLQIACNLQKSALNFTPVRYWKAWLVNRQFLKGCIHVLWWDLSPSPTAGGRRPPLRGWGDFAPELTLLANSSPTPWPPPPAPSGTRSGSRAGETFFKPFWGGTPPQNGKIFLPFLPIREEGAGGWWVFINSPTVSELKRTPTDYLFDIFYIIYYNNRRSVTRGRI